MRRLSGTKDRIIAVDDQIGEPDCARDIANTSISIAVQIIQEPNKHLYITTPTVHMSVSVSL